MVMEFIDSILVILILENGVMDRVMVSGFNLVPMVVVMLVSLSLVSNMDLDVTNLGEFLFLLFCSFFYSYFHFFYYL